MRMANANTRRGQGVLFSIAAMTLPAIAAAQTVPAPAPGAAVQAPALSPAPSPLANIPGVTVKYYAVTGATSKAIRASMDSQRPRDPVSGKSSPSSSNWSIGGRTQTAVAGNACKITGVNLQFKAEVLLPRLVNPPEVVVAERERANWQNYVTSIEQQQAAYLNQIVSRLPEVQRAVMASSCDKASDTLAAATARIRSSLVQAPAEAVATP